MIKPAVFIALALSALSAFAQSEATPGYRPQASSSSNQAGASTFSNQTAQTFSVDQLASQLQNLRTAVQQTLPSLTALNQNYSNSVSGEVGGAVSGLLSRALNRNQQNNVTSAPQSSLTVSNLVGALANLLSTNRNGGTPMPQNTLRDLEALQNSLQPVVAILDRLNVSNLSTNQFATPYNNTPLSTNRLTPTGR
jgi:hypothetical protein